MPKRRVIIFLLYLFALLAWGHSVFAEEIPPPTNTPVNDAVKYPQVNIEGFKEYRFNAVDILQGSDPTQYKKDPAYSNISSEALIYPGLRERFHLDIEGKLNDKLSVKYHLVQEPDLPEVFDIQVRYDKTVLQFGDFDQTFQSGTFIGVAKHFNGVQLYADYDNYDFKIVSSKEKSTAKSVDLVADGVRQEYALSNTNILEGSIRIFLNGVALKEGQDYTVNYYAGKINFSKIPAAGTAITAQYEFTNPIEDFLPVAGRKDFLGAQFNYRNQETVPSEQVYVRTTQEIALPTQMPIQTALLGDWINAPRVQTIPAGVSGNLSLEIRTSKYVTAIQFKTAQSRLDLVRAGLSATEQIWRVENWPSSANVLSGILSVSLDQLRLDFVLELERVGSVWRVKNFNTQPVAYLKNSKLLFLPARADQGQNLNLQLENQDLWREMRLIIGDVQSDPGKNSDGIWALNLTVPREFPTGTQTFYFVGIDQTGSTIKQAFTIPMYVVTQNQKVVERLSLDHSNLRLGGEQIFLGGQRLKQNQDYWLDYEKGEVTFKKLALSPDQKLQISYEYLSVQAREETLSGADYEGPYYLKFTPVLAKGMQVWVDQNPLTPQDYELDPMRGRLVFNFKVFKSSQIRVRYQSVDFAVPSAMKDKKKKSFEVGGGFLQETAKSSQSSLAKIGSETNPVRVTVNNRMVVKLAQSGIVNDTSFSISFNGVPGVQDVNYIFQPSRGWVIPTGSLTVTAGTAVNVSYKYTEKIKGIYLYFYRSNKSNWLIGSSTLRIRDLYPQNVPMAYKTLQIAAFREGSSDPIYLKENDDFTPGRINDINLITSANAILDVDNRLNFNNDFETAMQLGEITFVTGNNTAPKLLNIDSWMTNSNISHIRVLVDKVPNDVPDFGQIVHQVYDVHGSYYFNPDWSVYTDVAQSHLSFQRPVATFQNTFTVTSNVSPVFSLVDPSNANVEVEEDSVQVFLDGTTLLENLQFFINYKQGKITLIPQALPKSTGQLVVKFNYYSSSGVLAQSQNKVDNAYAVNVTGKITDVKLKSETQIIGQNFDPVGNIYYPAGSQVQRLTAEYVPMQSEWYAKTVLEDQKTKTGQGLQTGKDLFLDSGFQQYEVKYNTDTYNLARVYIQNRETIQDNPIETAITKSASVRDRQIELSGGFGNQGLNTQAVLQRKETNTNFLDRAYLPKDDLTNDFLQLKNYYQPSRNLTFTTDLQSSYAKRDKQLGGYSDTKYARVQVSYQPITYLNTNADVSIKTVSSEDQVSTNASLVTRSSQVLTTRYVQAILTRPDFWQNDAWSQDLYTRLGLNFKDDQVAQKSARPDTEARWDYFLGVTPYGWMKTSLDLNNSSIKRGDERDISQSDYYKLVFNDFRPFKVFPDTGFNDNFLILERMVFENSRSTRFNSLNNISVSGNNTDSHVFHFEQKYALVPMKDLVVTYFHVDHDDRYDNLDIFSIKSVSSLTIKPNFKRTYEATYTPDLFTMPLTGWGFSDNKYHYLLDLSGDQSRINIFDSLTASNNNSVYQRDVGDQKFDFQMRPAEPWRLSGLLGANSEYYTNSSGTAQSRITNKSNYLIDSAYSTWITGLVFNSSISQLNISQYSNSVANIPKQNLPNQNNALLTSTDSLRKVGLGYTPFAEMTFKGDFSLQDIDQNAAPVAPTFTHINVKDYAAGITYRPISGLTLDFTYHQKIFQDTFDGRQNVFRARYQPFDWAVGKIIFTYERDQNNGNGLNSVSQLINTNQNLGAIASDVVSRDDVRQTGVMTFELSNQITSQVLEQVNINASWTLISLIDNITRSNSYQISVLSLGAKFIF